MAYSQLSDFIKRLDKEKELIIIEPFVDPVLEITEITDRVTKSNGKALLFKNTGTSFPILINAYGSDKRILMALSRESMDDAGNEIEILFNKLTGKNNSLVSKIKMLPEFMELASVMPSYSDRRSACQKVVHMDPDLGILPVLKCWPYDGGRFITLPMVHTVHPETGKSNIGMYRMQILGKNTAAMHWQRHKTGASHFEAWKRTGRVMPVSVALGGDPVYAYSATAPLPENINEYILAGFLRSKKVKLVKCLTNDIYVPSDADIVIEGYVDPSEELIWEGPFGDHTGFYSLADWYPKFHVTCITHRQNAVYPATIVGIPPQEDAWLAKATERIFLAPVKMALQPEIIDFHLPEAGVAHNLMIVKISKSYPGQGIKVLSSLFGTGQMMFTKYLIVVNGEVDIRNYHELADNIFRNIDIRKDLFFSRGPLDVIDHSSDAFSFGGKMGIDATEKFSEELQSGNEVKTEPLALEFEKLLMEGLITSLNIKLSEKGIPIAIFSVNRTEDAGIIERIADQIQKKFLATAIRLILVVDHTVDTDDLFTVTWQVLGNSDPQRDHIYISSSVLLIDGTIKAYRKGGFTRKWPNVVCSDKATIETIDSKWDTLGLGHFIPSPSRKYLLLKRTGNDEISIHPE
ncbi:MAG TPA: menaquinone biosynthesis decarboxylase [Bacteroidales bacterium]|nr:menaquinone biosynthesis decarboxylase [Bacteroidales bacterium]